jgi:hypothetical protein
MTDKMTPLVSIGNPKYIGGLQGTLNVEVQLRLWQTLDEREVLWRAILCSEIAHRHLCKAEKLCLGEILQQIVRLKYCRGLQFALYVLRNPQMSNRQDSNAVHGRNAK